MCTYQQTVYHEIHNQNYAIQNTALFHEYAKNSLFITPHRPVTKQNLPLTQYSAFNSIARLFSLRFSPIFVLIN